MEIVKKFFVHFLLALERVKNRNVLCKTMRIEHIGLMLAVLLFLH